MRRRGPRPSRVEWVGALAALLALGSPTSAQDSPAPRPPEPARIEAEPAPAAPGPPDTLWDAWADQKERLREELGTTISLNVDLTAQTLLSGAENEGLTKGVARYDFLVRQALWDGALASMDVRGGWGEGVDDRLGLFANTNQYAETPDDAFILHLYLQQELADGQLTLRVGKFDIGDWIDANRFGFYNFLGYSFAHNSAIPLPGNTLGGMVSYEPAWAEWFYIQGGASNSIQSVTTSGFRETFSAEAEWLTIGELGVRPRLMGLDGTYRLIGWYDSRTFTGSGDDEARRGATGVALSFDQNLTERLGVFLRYGVADGDPFEPDAYWSAGFVLDEPFPDRQNDSLALGVVLHGFNDDRDALIDDATDTETYFEAYYNVYLTEWAALQPVIQVVDNPGGRDRDTAVIVGAHLALRF